MNRSRAALLPLLEIPFDFADPLSADSVRPGPSYFIVRAESPANSNAARSRSIGNPQTGAIRVASMFGTIGRLIDAYIRAHRPEWESFCRYDDESFYSQLCETGADVIILHAGREELLQRLKLDPSFCDIPIVLIDSWEIRSSAEARERWIRSGASAVLFIPFLDEALLNVIGEVLPETRPDSPRQ
jgi:hypothetical protein